MGVEAGSPSGDFEQSTGDCGVQQVPKVVVDSLSEVENYKMWVSWEWSPGELHVPVEMENMAVATAVAGREGTYP